MKAGGKSVSRVSSPVSWPILAVIGLGLLAVITTVWAITSHNKVEDLEREAAELRASANASIYQLEPTASAPPASQGQVFISLTGSGVVTVSNLPQAGDSEEFRLWFVQDDSATASGGTLSVDANGQGFALIPGDTGAYSQIAISLESVGSDDPAGTYLLIADVRSGRG